jgi:5'-nucleotidase
MKILLTNDDGVHARGLLALRASLAALGEVTVSAPAHERSAVSHALSIHRPIPEPRRVALRGGGPVYAIDGTPVDCVKLALAEFFREKPGLVVSGINPGLNTGLNILYSGTIGGAAEGALANLPAAAVSLEYAPDANPEEAARLASRLLRRLLARRILRPGALLNINLPVRPRPRGVRWTVMDRGPLAERYLRRADPRGRSYYWLTSPEDGGAPPARDGRDLTDNAAIAAGYISISPLQFDLTDRRALQAVTRRRGGLSW